jgi:Polysaccharide lyase
MMAVFGLLVFFTPLLDIIATNSSVPTISGTAQVDQTLTATTGTWTHNPTSFTYQWQRAGGALSGATASTYVPVAADVGSTSVVATNSGGSSSPAMSAATSAVTATSGVPVNTALPIIWGAAQVGQTLTASTGTWTNNPTSFTYQWQSAAPTPDIMGFAAPNNSVFTIGPWANNFVTENASQPWSITNPDSQTLRFEVRTGDHWPTDNGRVPEPDRSEVRLGVNSPYNIFPVGQEVNVSYNFMMVSSVPVPDTIGMTVGQFHNDDVTMGGHTSPPIEVDLQPGDHMSIYIGYLTANGGPTNCPFYGSQTVAGINISYCTAYLDPSNIVRGYNYKMQIQVKADPVNGFVRVWRDGVQIANSVGPVGFNFNTNWDFGEYKTSSPETQIAQYQNMMVSTRPLVLGTGPTYVPVAGDAVNALAVTVIATNGSGSSAPATSTITSACR